VTIDRIGDLEAGQLAALVAESEAQGLTFVRRLADEWATGVNRFDRPGEALFVARDDGRVVGVGGLNLDPYAAEPTVGRVRHLYVLTVYRRLGIGRRLVEEIVETARGRFERLRLSTSNPEAARLYERLGFRPRAGVAHCTHALEMSSQPERTAT
jgi:GNAT superfamily N-acetyltransferase